MHERVIWDLSIKINMITLTVIPLSLPTVFYYFKNIILKGLFDSSYFEGLSRILSSLNELYRFLGLVSFGVISIGNVILNPLFVGRIFRRRHIRPFYCFEGLVVFRTLFDVPVGLNVVNADRLSLEEELGGRDEADQDDEDQHDDEQVDGDADV